MRATRLGLSTTRRTTSSRANVTRPSTLTSTALPRRSCRDTHDGATSTVALEVEAKLKSPLPNPKVKKCGLFLSHPVRQLSNGWVLEIGHREVVVGCNSFTHQEFEGKYGTRWVVKIDGWLVRHLRLYGGVLVVEALEAAPDAATEKKGAEQLAVPFDDPR